MSLDRVYPLTLGSNIGTTTTSLLAALAASGHQREALQIALVHLMFNIHGILLLFPVPSLRLPVSMARRLGEVTARYRWFSLAYLLLMFFIFPAIIFGLSLAGPIAMYVVLVPVFLVFVLTGTLTLIQRKAPKILPARLRTWAFLPEPLRSQINEQCYNLKITAHGSCVSCIIIYVQIFVLEVEPVFVFYVRNFRFMCHLSHSPIQ